MVMELTLDDIVNQISYRGDRVIRAAHDILAARRLPRVAKAEHFWHRMQRNPRSRAMMYVAFHRSFVDSHRTFMTNEMDYILGASRR